MRQDAKEVGAVVCTLKLWCPHNSSMELSGFLEHCTHVDLNEGYQQDSTRALCQHDREEEEEGISSISLWSAAPRLGVGEEPTAQRIRRHAPSTIPASHEQGPSSGNHKVGRGRLPCPTTRRTPPPRKVPHLPSTISKRPQLWVSGRCTRAASWSRFLQAFVSAHATRCSVGVIALVDKV